MEKNLYWLKWELVKTAGARDGRRTVREEYEARALEMVMAKAEEKCRTYVGRIRENGGKNALFTMADAGSKGTHKNIYQVKIAFFLVRCHLSNNVIFVFFQIVPMPHQKI